MIGYLQLLINVLFHWITDTVVGPVGNAMFIEVQHRAIEPLFKTRKDVYRIATTMKMATARNHNAVAAQFDLLVDEGS